MNHPNRSKGKRGIPPSSPTPEQVRTLRAAAGLTQTEAAALVYVNLRAWQRWEQNEGEENARIMPASAWELFMVKLAINKSKLPREYLRHVVDELKIILPEDTP